MTTLPKALALHCLTLIPFSCFFTMPLSPTQKLIQKLFQTDLHFALAFVQEYNSIQKICFPTFVLYSYILFPASSFVSDCLLPKHVHNITDLREEKLFAVLYLVNTPPFALKDNYF